MTSGGTHKATVTEASSPESKLIVTDHLLKFYLLTQTKQDPLHSMSDFPKGKVTCPRPPTYYVKEACPPTSHHTVQNAHTLEGTAYSGTGTGYSVFLIEILR